MSVKVRRYRNKEGTFEVDIRFVWPDGTTYRERKRAPGTSESAARRWGEAREREVFKRGPMDPLPAVAVGLVPTLSGFRERYVNDHCLANKQKPSTVALKKVLYRAHLDKHLGEKRLDDITTADVDRLKGKLATLAPKSVNNVISLLSNVLKTARRWGVISETHCEVALLTVPKKEMGFYDYAAYARLVVAAKELGDGPYLAVLLAGDAGLRRGEVLALRGANVDVGRGVLKVVEAEWKGEVGTPKHGRIREVPMTSRLAAALAERRGQGRVLADDLVDERCLRGWIRQAEEKAGLAVTGKMHILRHTFCSHLAMKGAPAKAIQELAGHCDLSVTSRYMHLTPAARVDAIRLLEPSAAVRTGGEMMEKGSV